MHPFACECNGILNAIFFIDAFTKNRYNYASIFNLLNYPPIPYYLFPTSILIISGFLKCLPLIESKDIVLKICTQADTILISFSSPHHFNYLDIGKSIIVTFKILDLATSKKSYQIRTFIKSLTLILELTV